MRVLYRCDVTRLSVLTKDVGKSSILGTFAGDEPYSKEIMASYTN